MGSRVDGRWRDRLADLDELAPLLDGRLAPYVTLDNAASTPPLRVVLAAVEAFLPLYASVHRGTGYKSRVSTAAYQASASEAGGNGTESSGEADGTESPEGEPAGAATGGAGEETVEGEFKEV